MIGYLSGKLHLKLPSQIILSIGNIGYRVSVSKTTYENLILGSNLDLYIYSHIREDAFDLYGFKTSEELLLFELLLTVSGIGPKTALLVIDRGVDNVKNAIIRAKSDFFMLIPRLGKKNAQKIIIELKSKLGSLAELDLTEEGAETKDVIEALCSMGYSQKQVLSCLKNLPTDIVNIEDKIKFALKNLGKKKHD